MFHLLWYEIWSRRGAILGWGIGLTFYVFMYTLIYPEVADQMAGLGDLSIYQAMGIEVATFEGYLGSTIIGFIPILLGVYAVMTSTATLAGEEEDGTLELVLTTRLPRWQIVTAKALALLLVTAIIVTVAGVASMVAVGMVKEQITTSVSTQTVFNVMLSALPLVWALLMLGLFFGALLPSRRMAMMFGFLVLVGSYFGENIGGMVASMEVVKPYSLFTYFDSSSAVFTEGVAFGDVVVLLLVAAIGFGLALLSFQRRDVTVGNWFFVRGKVPA
jgi:ABC-2 type transport system permease protein